jgi:hypothetical protein
LDRIGAWALGFALVLIGLSLSVGILGYHFIAGLNWVDALLNASMILAGMGPVGERCEGLGPHPVFARAAIRTGAVHHVLAADQIARCVNTLMSRL